MPVIPNNVLVDTLITTLHGGVSDPCPMVRQCVIVGLSKVGICQPSRSGQVPAALAAVIQGLDDEEKACVVKINYQIIIKLNCIYLSFNKYKANTK